MRTAVPSVRVFEDIPGAFPRQTQTTLSLQSGSSGRHLKPVHAMFHSSER